MSEWPEGWERNHPRGDASSPRPSGSRSALPPELDPRGARRPQRPTGPADAPSSRSTTLTPPPARPPAAPTSAPPARRGGRSWLRRLLAVLLVLVLVLVAFYGWLAWHESSRLRHTGALPERAATNGTTWLLVGSDSREGLTRAQRAQLHTGQAEGQRTDTIILLQVPDSGRPTMVSLPRDSYVPIPGHGRNKLNAAFSFGGAPLLVRTVEDVTGLTVDHYVEIGFGGVVGVVDGLGGVDVCVKRAMNDSKSGLHVKAGCQEFDGATALAYARARYSDPLGDLGRVQRQQQLVSAMIHKAFTPGVLLDPLQQHRVADAATAAVKVDDGTGLTDLVGLARALRAISSGKGVATTVPVADPGYSVPGVGDTVRWDRAKAQQLFADLEAGRPVSGVKAKG
ncbi:MAG: LCP family protein [Motilibacteraceae bacterium]